MDRAALLGSALLYLRARERGTLRSWRGMLPLVLMAAAGMMAKEQGFVAWSSSLAGLEWLVPAEPGHRCWHRLRPLLPLVAVTAAMLLARTAVTASLRGEAAAPALAGLGIGGRVLTFLAVVAQYARLLVWPAHLQAAYGPPMLPAGGPFGPVQAVGLAARARRPSCSSSAAGRVAPIAAFGLWWAAVTLAPVSNLLMPTGLLMAERVFFLPSIGFAMARRRSASMRSRPIASCATGPLRMALAAWARSGWHGPRCARRGACRSGTTTACFSRN